MNTRNNSIDIFRLIFAISIVMIHSRAISGWNDKFSTAFIDFMLRVGVPFFFCISGFFLIKSLLNNKKVIKKTLITILKTYIFWTVIYYLASFVDNVIMSNHPIKQFLIERIWYFITVGSYPHFWYLTSMMYTIIIIFIFDKFFGEKGIRFISIISILFYFLGVLGTTYYRIGYNIPIISKVYTMKNFEFVRNVSSMGLPYFTLGYWINVLEKRIIMTEKRKLISIMLICYLVYIIEILVLVYLLDWTDKPELIFSTYFMAATIFIVLYKFPMPSGRNISKKAKRLANYIYFSHPLFLVVLDIALRLLSIEANFVVLFVSTMGLCMLTGLLIMKWNSSIRYIMMGENKNKLIHKEEVKHNE